MCCLMDARDSGDIFVAVVGFLCVSVYYIFAFPVPLNQLCSSCIWYLHKADADAGLPMPGKFAQREAAEQIVAGQQRRLLLF